MTAEEIYNKTQTNHYRLIEVKDKLKQLKNDVSLLEDYYALLLIEADKLAKERSSQ